MPAESCENEKLPFVSSTEMFDGQFGLKLPRSSLEREAMYLFGQRVVSGAGPQL